MKAGTTTLSLNYPFQPPTMDTTSEKMAATIPTSSPQNPKSDGMKSPSSSSSFQTSSGWNFCNDDAKDLEAIMEQRQDQEDSTRDRNAGQCEINYEEIEYVRREATIAASVGNERHAIELYNDCLKTLQKGIRLISQHIEDAAATSVVVADTDPVDRANVMSSTTQKSKFVKTTSTYIIFRDEWKKAATYIAQVRTTMAVLFERLGRYDKALDCCIEARDVYKRLAKFDHEGQKVNHSPNDINGSNIMHVKNMDHMILKIEASRNSYPKRRALFSRVSHNYEKMTSTSQDDCGTTTIAATAITQQQQRMKLYMDARTDIDTLFSLQVDQLGPTHPDVADTKALLAKLLVEGMDLNGAERNILDAISMSEISLGQTHPRTAAKYQQAAEMYELRCERDGTFMKAVGLYDQAIDSYKKSHGDHVANILWLAGKIGRMYLKLNEYDLAIERLNDAVQYRISKIFYINDRVDDIPMHELNVWLGLADCFDRKKDLKSQTFALKNALQIQRRLRKRSESHILSTSKSAIVDSPAEAIVDVLTKIGKCFALQKLYSSSCDHLEEALLIIREEYTKAKTEAKSTSKQNLVELRMYEDKIASILYCLGEVRKSNKEYSLALPLYRECLKLRMKRCQKLKKRMGRKDDGDSSSLSSSHFDCAMALASIGSVEILQGDHEQAFKTINQALYYARCSDLPPSHPLVISLWEDSKIAGSKMKRLDEHTDAFLTAASSAKKPESETSNISSQLEYEEC